MSNTLTEATNRMEQARVNDIVEFVKKYGWSYDAAVAQVLNSSTFSTKRKTIIANKAKAILQPRG